MVLLGDGLSHTEHGQQTEKERVFLEISKKSEPKMLKAAGTSPSSWMFL